jgi:hypothetical protein
MIAQIVADVVPVFTAFYSLLHHNDVRVTYLAISNLRLEPIRFVSLYFVAMPQSMVIVTKVPFLTTLVHTIVNMRSKPQIPRETQLVSVHTEMPKEVDRIFARQPLDLGGGSSDPPGPP